jgi:hypothetical protein
VNIKLFRDVDSPPGQPGDVTSVRYSERGEANTWSDQQPF